MVNREQAAAVMESSTTSPVVGADVDAIAKIKESITNLQLQQIANLDQGDPTMYESYWKSVDESLKVTISASQSLSYFANPNSFCWFLTPQLEQQIKTLHNLVGNAVIDDRHVVVGNGSSQLIQAALYALADPLDAANPIPVISPTPFYSCYPQIADYVRSGLFKWGGDAYAYDKEDEAYIELVTSPNNPDGEIRTPVVNKPRGMLVHDLAYYWPQYTAITSPADHDIMLFTLSKCTGHAGSRIGWAIVKDAEVAKRMTKFIEINTIGVSKESQIRAASVLQMVCSSCNGAPVEGLTNFFEHGQVVMAERWRKLREALKGNEELLQVPDFPLEYCNFNREFVQARPAYAWMKAKQGVDLGNCLAEKKVKARAGTSFGCGPEYVRASLLGREEDFEMFLNRIPSLLQLLALK